MRDRHVIEQNTLTGDTRMRLMDDFDRQQHTQLLKDEIRYARERRREEDQRRQATALVRARAANDPGFAALLTLLGLQLDA